MRVIGIDPAINNTGWAILEKTSTKITYIDSGTIKTSSSQKIQERLSYISSSIAFIINKYNPFLCSIEEIFVNINPKSTLILSHARGAILSKLGELNIDILEFSPNKIKKTIVGNGKADKIQVQKMLSYVIENASFKNNDESDAIAIAYTGLIFHSNFNIMK